MSLRLHLSKWIPSAALSDFFWSTWSLLMAFLSRHGLIVDEYRKVVDVSFECQFFVMRSQSLHIFQARDKLFCSSQRLKRVRICNLKDKGVFLSKILDIPWVSVLVLLLSVLRASSRSSRWIGLYLNGCLKNAVTVLLDLFFHLSLVQVYKKWKVTFFKTVCTALVSTIAASRQILFIKFVFLAIKINDLAKLLK